MIPLPPQVCGLLRRVGKFAPLKRRSVNIRSPLTGSRGACAMRPNKWPRDAVTSGTVADQSRAGRQQ